MATPSVCDVNRVQGVTSSRGRLLTSALMPKSAVSGRGENMKADRQREAEMGAQGIRELKRYDIAHPSHLVQQGHLLKVIVMWFHSCTV